MRVEELMIGDWVCVINESPRLNPEPLKTVVLEVSAKHDDVLTVEGLVSTCMVHPIQLTDEILQKNGFVVTRNFGESGNKDMWQYMSVILYAHHDRKEYPYYWNRICNFEYVHQLQHIIRLCGFDELANNFKI